MIVEIAAYDEDRSAELAATTGRPRDRRCLWNRHRDLRIKARRSGITGASGET